MTRAVEPAKSEGDSRFARSDFAAVLFLAVGAGAVTFGILWARAVAGRGIPSIDIYEYSYPIFVYAQTALAQGHGLLWNPLQNAGQPFLAIPSVALLYPPNLLGLAFEARTWLVGQALFHLFAASAGSYVLARVIGLARGAAVASAIAMLLGGVTIAFAAWSPLVLAAYAWMPWAAALTERVLKRPDPTAIVGLGTVLTLQILAGFPQIAVFSYEVSALRLVWYLARPNGERWAPVFAVVLGMALPLGLGAIQLLPAVEVLGDSVRNLPISKDALRVGAQSNAEIIETIWRRSQLNSAFFVSVAGVALSIAALAVRRRRSLMLFYGGVGLLSIGLVFDSPLLDLYQVLPVVGSLRGPGRFFWVTSFAVSVLVGFGAQALCDRSSARLAACLAALVVVAFAVLGPGPIHWWEWSIAAAALVSALGAFRHRDILAPLALCVALAICLWMQNRAPLLAWLPDETSLRQGEAAFLRIAGSEPPGRTMTIERRQRLQPRFLNEKTPSLFGLPGVSDYEHLTSRRYAELYLRMTILAPVESADQWIKGRTARPRRRAILDLLGVRWIVTSGDYRPTELGLHPVLEEGAWHLFENDRALPRASFVPSAVVIGDPQKRLAVLGRAAFDPRRQLILDEMPEDAFLGEPDAKGSVDLVLDESEKLVLSVETSGEGFLLITDQHHPGWKASVDGVPTPILRANHALRAIRVPDGSSIVELRFRPWSVPAGAAISAVSILSCAVWLWRTTRRQRRLYSR